MKTNYKIKFYQLPFTQESDNRYTDIVKIESYKLTDWIQANDNNGSGVRKYWNWFLTNQLRNIYRKTIDINIDLIPAAKTFNFCVVDFGDDKNIFNLQKVGFWNVGNENLVSETQLSYELEIDVVFSYGKEFLTQIEGKQVKVNSAHLNVLIKNGDKLKSVIFNKDIENDIELQSVLNGKEFESNNYLKNDNNTKIYDPLQFIIKLKHEHIVINENTFNSIDWKNMWQYRWREFFLEIYGRNLPWQKDVFTKNYVGITDELDLYNLWFEKNWKWVCFLYSFFFLQTGNQDNNGFSSNIALLLNDGKVSFHSVHKDNFSSKNPNIFPLMTQQTYNKIITSTREPFLKKVGTTDYYILKESKSDNYVDGNWLDVAWSLSSSLPSENIEFIIFRKIDNNNFEFKIKEIIFNGDEVKKSNSNMLFNWANRKLEDYQEEVVNNKTYKTQFRSGVGYVYYINNFLWSLKQKVLDYSNNDGVSTYGRILRYWEKNFKTDTANTFENFYKITLKRDGTKRIILEKQKSYIGGDLNDERNVNWDMSGYADYKFNFNNFQFYYDLWEKKEFNKNESQTIYYRQPNYDATTKKVSYSKGMILENKTEPHIENLDKIIELWFNKHKYGNLSANLDFTNKEIIKTYFAEHSNFFLDISDGRHNVVAYWIINNVKQPTLNDINNTLGSVEGVEPKLNNILERLVMRHKRDWNFVCFYLRQKAGDRNIYLLNTFNKIKYQNLEYNLSGLDETKIYTDNKAKKLDDILHIDYALEIYTPELLNYHFNEIVMRNGDKFLVNNYDVINDMNTIFFQNTISGQLWLFDNQKRRIQNKLVNSLEVPIVENQLEIQKRHFQKELDVENSKLDLEDKKLKLGRERELSAEKYNTIRSSTNLGTSILGGIVSGVSAIATGGLSLTTGAGLGASAAGIANSGINLAQTLENQKLSKRAHSLNLESRSLARQDYQNQLTRKSFAIESTGISDAQSVMKDDFRSPLALEHKELGVLDKKKIAEYHHLFGSQLQYIDVFNKTKYLNRLLFNYLSLTNINTTFTKIPTPFLTMIKTSFASGVRLWEVNFDKQKLNWQKGLE